MNKKYIFLTIVFSVLFSTSLYSQDSVMLPATSQQSNELEKMKNEWEKIRDAQIQMIRAKEAQIEKVKEDLFTKIKAFNENKKKQEKGMETTYIAVDSKKDDSLEKERLEWERRKINLENKIRDLENRNLKNEDLLESEKTKNLVLQTKVNTLEKEGFEKAENNIEASSLAIEKENLDNQKLQFNQERMEWKADLREAKAANETEKKRILKEISDLEKKKNDLLENNKKLKDNKNELQRKEKLLDEKVKDLNDKENKWHQEKESLEKKHSLERNVLMDEKNADFNQKLTAFANKQNEFKKKVSALEIERQDILKTKKEIEDKEKAWTLEKSSTKNAFDLREEKISRKEAGLAKQTKRLTNKKEKLTALEGDLQLKEKRISIRENDLMKKKDDLEQGEEQKIIIDGLREEKQKLEDQNKTLRDRNAGLEDQLENASIQLDALRNSEIKLRATLGEKEKEDSYESVARINSLEKSLAVEKKTSSDFRVKLNSMKETLDLQKQKMKNEWEALRKREQEVELARMMLTDDSSKVIDSKEKRYEIETLQNSLKEKEATLIFQESKIFKLQEQLNHDEEFLELRKQRIKQQESRIKEAWQRFESEKRKWDKVRSDIVASQKEQQNSYRASY